MPETRPDLVSGVNCHILLDGGFICVRPDGPVDLGCGTNRHILPDFQLALFTVEAAQVVGRVEGRCVISSKRLLLAF